MNYRIRFNVPFIAGNELELAARCMASAETAGDGSFSKECQHLLEERLDAKRVLLTNSCTSALEIAALLCDVQPGDEVILPSYTFVSTANAFLLRGASLKFVDVRTDTLNLDERLLRDAITAKTKAIVPVHYAGVACEMDTIVALAREHSLFVVEDAAQAVSSRYKGRALGTVGNLGAFSFHATKNFSCGEGGALVINDEAFIERAEIIREKGTNRSRFYRGQVDKYTWVDVGSSYVLADLLAAFLLAQLQRIDAITAERKRVYDHYFAALQPLAARGLVTLPSIPPDCKSNYHMFYVLTQSLAARTGLIEYLKGLGIAAPFHYVPLHTSSMGASLGYRQGMLPVTESVGEQIVRLPMFPTLAATRVEEIVDAIFAYFEVRRG